MVWKVDCLLLFNTLKTYIDDEQFYLHNCWCALCDQIPMFATMRGEGCCCCGVGHCPWRELDEPGAPLWTYLLLVGVFPLLGRAGDALVLGLFAALLERARDLLGVSFSAAFSVGCGDSFSWRDLEGVALTAGCSDNDGAATAARPLLRVTLAGTDSSIWKYKINPMPRIMSAIPISLSWGRSFPNANMLLKNFCIIFILF